MKIAKFNLTAVLALGALLACTNLVSAQDAKNGNENKGKKRGANVEQQLQRMDQELKLSDEQKTKLKAVFEEGNKKRQEFMRDNSVAREDRREKMQALMKEQNEKIKGILTAEQWQKWEKARQEMRKNGRQGEKKRSNDS
jgi:Spy/CpxP family protein refolding chaperone